MTWSKLSGVVLSENQRGFLDEFAKRLPFNIIVTSGTRTPQAQARAMFDKIELGDDLLKIYADDVFAQSIIDAYPNIEQATEIVEQYARSGRGSDHLTGNAVDIRTRDLTEDQKNTMVAVVQEMGNFALLEATPPHLHITLKKNYQPMPKISNLFILVLAMGAMWKISQI
jgi:hypothetical protein